MTGEVEGTALNGNLYLLGSGDPTLKTDQLAQLVEALEAAGILSVRGDFIVSGGGFARVSELDPTQPPQVGYNPTISGLNLNFNRVWFDWERAGAGYKATMRAVGNIYTPDTPVSRIHIDGNRDFPVYRHSGTASHETWSVARSALGKAGGRWLPTRVPELYAGEAFVGIGRTLGIFIPPPHIGGVPNGAFKIADVKSGSLSEMAKGMLKYSTNLTAEVLGFAASGNTQLAASSAALSDWCQDWGVNGAFKDHSGLREHSRVSAEGLVNFFVGHRDGPLRDVLKAVDIKDEGGAKIPGLQMVAKTGSLNFVSTLAGYLFAPRQNFAFAILSADLPRIVTVAWFHQVETGRRVRVYNTHWSHVSAEAREGSARLIASLDAIHEADATAVLGDFNEEADAPGRRALSDAGFVDTYDEVRARCRKTFPSYTTFTPEGSSGGPKIDAIYVKDLKTEWTCVDEIIKKDVFISDHLPVHAVVSWASVRE